MTGISGEASQAAPNLSVSLTQGKCCVTSDELWSKTGGAPQAVSIVTPAGE